MGNLELKKLKKADKARKLVLAQRAGYATVEAYMKWLQESVSKSSNASINKEVTLKKPEFSCKTDFKVGDIVTITQHYKIKDLADGSNWPVVLVDLVPNSNKGVNTDEKTLRAIFKSGDNYSSVSEITRTDMISILESNKNQVLTVGFFKKDTEKSKTLFELEKRQKIEKIKAANLATIDSLLNDLIENPILKIIPGEYRILRGFHSGGFDSFGRLYFTDADEKIGEQTKLIDPRTIDMLIVNNTKYKLK